MKINDEHYQTIKQGISLLRDKVEPHRKFIVAQGKARDVEKRLRWDLLYASAKSQWVCDNLYPYLHDDHIDTALKSIVKELGL